ncbi:hypothetical protein HK101_001719 [Irineochytrium annulatum]|nr:hypothetical protein HK101_001719 [Irineochytrium annulatum]
MQVRMPSALATVANFRTSNTLQSVVFQVIVVLAVIANVVTIADETELAAHSADLFVPDILQEVDLVFLAVYLIEFLLKVYVEPVGYWRNSYNRFDCVILALCIVQWALSNIYVNIENNSLFSVMRGLRALRAFRGISFTRSLQVVVNALLNTLKKNVVDIVVLLVLIMFIFGVLGRYLYGTMPGTNSYEDWGTLGSSFMTLFIFVCADGWTKYQTDLTDDGYKGSEIFTVVFIFIGNFIIANLFIGVICQNIDDATEADRQAQREKKREAKLLKRELFLRKQRKDMSQLVAQTANQNRNFQELLQEMVGTLRHEDVVPMTHIACNLTWLETFAVTLTHQENTMYRCQQLHFGIANTLAEYGSTAPANWKNVNNWHWVEKNCFPWANDYLKEKLTGVSVEVNGTHVESTGVTSVTGDVDINQRKGKLITVYDLAMNVSWTGKNAAGTEAKGKIEFPEFMHDTDLDELSHEVTVDSSDKDSYAIKEVVRTKLIPELKKRLTTFSKDMVEYLTLSKHPVNGKDVHIPKNEMTGHPVMTPYKPKPVPNDSATTSSTSKAGSEKVLGALTTVTKTVEFVCSAQDLYDTLLVAERVQIWSRGKAVIGKNVGADVEMFGGNVTGKIMELEEGKKIVMSWRLKSWPSGHFSKVKLELEDLRESVKLKLTQSEVPVGEKDSTLKNWEGYYFQGIKSAFGYGAVGF